MCAYNLKCVTVVVFFLLGGYLIVLPSSYLSLKALLYLRGLNSNTSEVVAGPYGEKAPPSKEKVEINETMGKVYSNMSACLIKQGKWQRAIDSADKALALNENNFKAMFRKGKALGELGFFEKSSTLLDTLLEKNPADAPTINAEIARFKVKEKSLEKAANEKLRGFLNREKSTLAPTEKNED